MHQWLVHMGQMIDHIALLIYIYYQVQQLYIQYSYVMNLDIKLTSALYIHIYIVNKGIAHHYPVAHC